MVTKRSIFGLHRWQRQSENRRCYK